MLFELTEPLVENILFSMEDQGRKFLIDTQEGTVLGKTGELARAAEKGKNHYVDLPKWDSSDGFRLMERFAAAFRNPMVREELSGALNRGKGVFRAFKDTLSQYPEAEKRWFLFKEQEMKREIFRWYNALREERGLERIGEEPEETGDLVLEDFRFRESGPEDEEAAAELHRICAEEERNWAGENGMAGTPEIPPPGGERVLAAETGGGDFAGYISVSRRETLVRITALEVRPEYRGFGIGEALVSRLLEQLRKTEVSHVTIDVPAGAEGFSRVLLRSSFKPLAVRYCRKIDDP
ncbi:MAG: GNAT family N-acetyltransferase [Treponema sp.]|jgi:GNAT superfamily N-acetyltransferase|nr:GNAT family N-acetyltransferase [Treponema sp.]